MNTRSESTMAEEFANKIRKEQHRAKVIQIAPLLVLAGLIIILTILKGNSFASLNNFLTIFTQMSIPLLIGIGLTFVIILGSIDLSIDGAVGMSGAIFALLVLNNKNVNNLGIMAVLITLVVSVAIGFLIGLVHTKMKIPSFMVSYSFMYICLGIGMLSYGGAPATIYDEFFISMTKSNIFGFPFITFVSIIVLIAAYFLQERTAFGRYIYAIGTSENIPRLAGIKVDRVKILVFMFSSFCFALAGMIGAVRLGQGQVQIGIGMMFPAQSAVIVGGTSLSGGKGGVINTLVGVLIITVLENGLIHLGLDPYWRTGIQGMIILIAVALTVAKSRKIITK